jgi:hypothetical protein
MAIETIDATHPPIGESSQTTDFLEAQSVSSYTSHCHYQPNGVSQYDIVFTQYETVEGQQKRINLAWLKSETGGVTFNISVGLLYRCSVGYVMEKTGIENEIDAVYLLLFLKDQGFCLSAFDNGDYEHYVNSPVQRTIEYP